MSNGATATAKMIGHNGPFEIHKICINSHPNGVPQNQRYARQPKLGLELKSTEWMSRDLYRHFSGGGGMEAASVKHVAPRSLAEQAGVLVGDALCYSSDPPTGVFHELLQMTPPTNPVQWHLLSSAQFQEMLAGKKKQKTLSLVFYVARKNAEVPTGSPNDSAAAISEANTINITGRSKNTAAAAATSSCNGVTLSQDIVARAATFSSLSPTEQIQLLADAKQDAKEQFEAERDAVLEALPGSVKAMFFQVGFAQWGRSKKYLPVIILDPYSVPPASSARTAWMKKFHARKQYGTLDKMNYLVFWYGETFLSSNANCFSLLAQDDAMFITLEQAKKQNLISDNSQYLPRHTTARMKKKMARLRDVTAAAKMSIPQRRASLPMIREFYELLCPQDLAQYDTTTYGRSFTSSSAHIVPSSAGSTSTAIPQRQRRRRLDQKQPPSSPTKRQRATAPDVSNHDEDDAIREEDAQPLQVESNPKSERKSGLRKVRRTMLELRSTNAFIAIPEAQESSRSTVSVSPNHDDDGDRKPAARRAILQRGRRKASEPATAQAAIDSYCIHVQGIKSRNAELWLDYERLQSDSKACRKKYEDLVAAVDSFFGSIDLYDSETGSFASSEATCGRENSGGTQRQHIEMITSQAPLNGNTGDDTDSTQYLKSMCDMLGEMDKQNTDLQRVNGLLEKEVKRWNSKFEKLDAQVKHMRNLREELD